MPPDPEIFEATLEWLRLASADLTGARVLAKHRPAPRELAVVASQQAAEKVP